MKLTDEVFRSFRVAKVFRENTDRINCIDFSANGEHMISSSNDDSIVVYCCQEGRWVRLIWNITCAEGGEIVEYYTLCPVSAGQRGLFTARNMAAICCSIHMHPIQSFTLQINKMVSHSSRGGHSHTHRISS